MERSSVVSCVSSAVLILCLGRAADGAHHRFGYTREDQLSWSADHRECKGKLQSPIHILRHKAIPLALPALEMVGYHNLLPGPLRLTNTGHSVSMEATRIEESVKFPTVFGAFLANEYELESLHFHWGSKNDRGSEHMLNGIRYPMEMHIIHRNLKYKTLRKALGHRDGLAVLAVFFQLREKANRELGPLLSSLNLVEKRGQVVHLNHTFTLSSLLPKDLQIFYTYGGSLTTPPCSEAVTWILFPEPVLVSFGQLRKFRKLSRRKSSMKDNYRHIQVLGPRNVFVRRMWMENEDGRNHVRQQPPWIRAMSTDSQGTSGQHCHSTSSRPCLELRRALLVTKLSRYELERRRYPHLEKVELEQRLRSRGSDVEMLLYHHDVHKQFESSLDQTMRTCGIETKVVNRFELTQADVDWADVVCPTGGDGTFLMVASRILGNQTLVVGFNSDPSRSEGHLCLPKKYSVNIKEAIDKLRKGLFKWMFRNRIRVVLHGEHIFDPPILLHEQLVTPRISYDYGQALPQAKVLSSSMPRTDSRVLPVLALNEVFIGESVSARVSYFEMRLGQDAGVTKVKSSGLCVSTGTGSTSWHLSINRLTGHEVVRLADILGAEQGLAAAATQEYNDSLIFAPDDCRMAYTIRELISAGVWPHPHGIEPRDYATRIEVRSRCFDAGLVVDGGISYPFNDGTVATLQIHDEDSLRTVMFLED